MEFSATVPSHDETALTGFIGAGEVQRGKVNYRVELYSGKPPQCFYKGTLAPVSHTKTMLQLALAVRKFFNV